MRGKRSAVIVELHGLVIDTELPMVGRRAQAGAVPDVTVEVASAAFPQSQSQSGERVATFELGASRYHIERTADCYFARFPGLVDFRLGRRGETTRVEVSAATDTEPELVSLLLSGNVLALAMMRRNLTVLHASAVTLDSGLTLAFVGASGMGKSTLAGLLCTAGARLVADDVLRVGTDTEAARCFPGSPELRLRTKAKALAALIPATHHRETCDERLTVRPARTVEQNGALDAILVPHLDAAAVGTRLRRLSRVEATTELLKYPRLLGWRSPDWLAFHLRHAADVVRRIPVFEAHLPRFESFSATQGAAIAADLQRELQPP